MTRDPWFMPVIVSTCITAEQQRWHCWLWCWTRRCPTSQGPRSGQRGLTPLLSSMCCCTCELCLWVTHWCARAGRCIVSFSLCIGLLCDHVHGTVVYHVHSMLWWFCDCTCDQIGLPAPFWQPSPRKGLGQKRQKLALICNRRVCAACCGECVAGCAYVLFVCFLWEFLGGTLCFWWRVCCVKVYVVSSVVGVSWVRCVDVHCECLQVIVPSLRVVDVSFVCFLWLVCMCMYVYELSFPEGGNLVTGKQYSHTSTVCVWAASTTSIFP